jgi:hypothetical protein
MRRAVPLLLLAVLAISATAAEIQLSPARPLSPGGVAIAYSAYDATSGGVPRVFVRTLAQGDAIPGRRRSAHP